MSLDPLLVVAAVIVAPAAGLVLLTSSRTRYSARSFRAARRLLGGALLLALVLAAVATFRWSDATMGATTSLPDTPAPGAARPPLAGFLILAALAGVARAVASRRRGAAAPRSVARRRARPQRRGPLGSVGGPGRPAPAPHGAADGTSPGPRPGGGPSGRPRPTTACRTDGSFARASGAWGTSPRP